MHIFMGKRERTEEDSDSEPEFLTFVPVAHEQCERGEQTAFKEPKQNTSDHERTKRADKPRAETNNAP